MSWEEKLPAALARWFQERELPVHAGWTGEHRASVTGATAVVTVQRYEARSAGLGDYLGERYNGETGRWEEVYGRAVSATLGLDLYATERGSEGELQQLLEGLVGVLTLEPPAGLLVGDITCGETRWDEEQRCLKREVRAACTLWLQAVQAETGEFLDFELRGGWKH